MNKIDKKTFDNIVSTIIENSKDKKSLELETTILKEKERIKISVSETKDKIFLTSINADGTESHFPLTDKDNVALDRDTNRTDIAEQQLCGIILFAFVENQL